MQKYRGEQGREARDKSQSPRHDHFLPLTSLFLSCALFFSSLPSLLFFYSFLPQLRSLTHPLCNRSHSELCMCLSLSLVCVYVSACVCVLLAQIEFKKHSPASTTTVTAAADVAQMSLKGSFCLRIRTSVSPNFAEQTGATTAAPLFHVAAASLSLSLLRHPTPVAHQCCS